MSEKKRKTLLHVSTLMVYMMNIKGKLRSQTRNQ